MKTIRTAFFLNFLLASLAWATSVDSNWKLVWSDEFDRQGHPNPKKWTYEEGFVRNAEPQYYTGGRLENVRVESGKLIIEARKEEFPNEHIHPPTEYGSQSCNPVAHYTSGSITTEGRASWCYGRFEIRAKLPTGVGSWPSFWTLGNSWNSISWPACGELDIMEYWGRHRDLVTSSVHYSENGVHRHLMGQIHTKSPVSGFHRYAMEWYPDRLDFYMDDLKYFSVPMSRIHVGDLRSFHRPHFILLNLALDRGNKWIDDAAFPQRFIIDYVRIYQKPGAGL